MMKKRMKVFALSLAVLMIITALPVTASNMDATNGQFHCCDTGFAFPFTISCESKQYATNLRLYDVKVPECNTLHSIQASSDENGILHVTATGVGVVAAILIDGELLYLNEDFDYELVSQFIVPRGICDFGNPSTIPLEVMVTYPLGVPVSSSYWATGEHNGCTYSGLIQLSSQGNLQGGGRIAVFRGTGWHVGCRR